MASFEAATPVIQATDQCSHFSLVDKDENKLSWELFFIRGSQVLNFKKQPFQRHLDGEREIMQATGKIDARDLQGKNFLIRRQHPQMIRF